MNKILKVGIATVPEQRARTLAIAAGVTSNALSVIFRSCGTFPGAGMPRRVHTDARICSMPSSSLKTSALKHLKWLCGLKWLLRKLGAKAVSQNISRTQCSKFKRVSKRPSAREWRYSDFIRSNGSRTIIKV